MKKMMLWYSELYPYAFGYAILVTFAHMYCFSTGNIPNTHVAFLLWTFSLIIGLTSLSCHYAIKTKREQR